MDLDATKERLIVTAEQLFAEHGLSGVTVRQINEAAGQRNTSAIYYHFGCKARLIGAIFAYRLDAYEQVLKRMWTTLERSGGPLGVREIIKTLYAPQHDILFDPGRAYHLRFVAQHVTDPQALGVPFETFFQLPTVQIAMNRLRTLTTHVPETVFMHRMRSYMFMSVTTSADWVRALYDTPVRMTAEEVELAYEALIDGATALIAGPISAATAQRLAQLAEVEPVSQSLSA
ncbi:MAG: TetR/AcrR family transcriptional regulator [Alphaproteobacteria bacterium]|nr:TetR/AcrR family transcriptional regulator [Alphaproteobacteria bacterium]